MHYAILDPIRRPHSHADWGWYDGAICDRALIKRLISEHTDDQSEIVEFDLADLFKGGLMMSRVVTKELVLEAYEDGNMSRDAEIVRRFLGPAPLTRDEHLANLGDADWHSGEAA